MPTSLNNSRTQQGHCILASRRATGVARAVTPPAMRMRKLNVPPQRDAAYRPKEGGGGDAERTLTAEDRNNILFDSLWKHNDQNKENSLVEWGGGSVSVPAKPSNQVSPSPVGAALARPREVSSMPVPSARKRASSPSYDPPCKKALNYDHPIVTSKSPLASSQSSRSDSQDSESSGSGSQRSLFASRRPAVLNGSARLGSSPVVGVVSPATTPVRPHSRLHAARFGRRPSIGHSDTDQPALTSDQKMEKALNIRPSLMKHKGRSLTERMKNSKLLHDVVLPSGPSVLTSHEDNCRSASLRADDDIFTDSDEILAELLHPADSTSANPFLVDEELINGPFAAREETVAFLSSHVVEAPCEPHTIGFFNPGNLCWMNAVVQCVISLSPLMGDIQEYMADGVDQPSANKYSNVLRGLIKILSLKRQGVASRVKDSLRKFHRSLEVLKPEFATDTQQDCPEFLTELLDHLRDEFYRLSRNEGAKLREISDNAGATAAAARDGVPNPVRDNTEISMRQQKTCISCSEMVVGEIREPILIVDLPDLPTCSLQHAIKGYFKSADIERQCDSCSAKTSRTTTAISRLPRVLTVQLKRYVCKAREGGESTFFGIEKVNSRVKIPEWLSVQDIITDDVQLPSVRRTSSSPTPMAVYLDESSNQEDRELEEAKLRSIEITLDETEEEQLRQAMAASMLDAPRNLPGSLSSTPVKDGSTPVKEDDQTYTRDYRLVAFIQHMGVNPNSGHYMASVYNFSRKCWINYNDTVVLQHTFEEATGGRAPQNGYIFFYLHRSQFEEQAAAERGDDG